MNVTADHLLLPSLQWGMVVAASSYMNAGWMSFIYLVSKPTANIRMTT